MSEIVVCAVCGEQVAVDLESVVTQTRQPVFGPAPGRGAVHQDGRVIHECVEGRY
jgi:hypothetical protein